jgi:hypothetical protein
MSFIKYFNNMTSTALILGALISIVSLGIFLSSSASAATSTLNNGGGSVPVYFAPNTQYSNVKVWAPNNTRFQMNCWLDNAGHRWFYGQEYSQGAWGYATAGVVKNQISVSHC